VNENDKGRIRNNDRYKNVMIVRHLKQTYFIFKKNKLFTALNLCGLAIGFASFILISMQVSREYSYDKFYSKSDRIYRVYMEYLEGDQYVPADAQTYNLTGPTLKKELPEIESFVRIYELPTTAFKKDNNYFSFEDGLLVDPNYFSVFDIPLVYGDKNHALSEPSSVVLCQSVASKMFGTNNPVGQQITIYDGSRKNILNITGVMQDVPQNTHLKTNFLIPYGPGNKLDREPKLNWSNNSFFTFLLLKENVNIEQLSAKIKALEVVEDERHCIEPLTDIHLNSHKPYESEQNGSISKVRFLSAIAIIIMFLSWFNYINLSVSSLLDRAKGVGVRKALGAAKFHVIGQFLIESVLMNMVSLLLSAVLIIAVIPYFSGLNQNSFDQFIHSNDIYILLSFVLLGILASGLYPAIVLSNFNTLLALKGKNNKSQSAMGLRKVIITTQIAATIILLVSTFIINNQVNLLRNLPLGYNSSNIIAINAQVFSEEENNNAVYSRFMQEVLKLPIVEKASKCSNYPSLGYENAHCNMGSLTYPDGTHDERSLVYYNVVDSNYFDLMQHQFLAGEPLRKTSNRFDMVINEKMAKKMGYTYMQEAIGKQMDFISTKWTITGVVKDFNYFGIKSNNEFLVFYRSSIHDYMLLKLNKDCNSQLAWNNAISDIKQTWNSVCSNSIMEYQVLDDRLEKDLEEDRQFNAIFSAFTILAIIIASLGLFGTATQLSHQRTKEIGIRKVNGAKITEVLILLNKDFIKWVVIAFVMACPIAYYAMSKWLEDFAYKTELSWWIFALAGVLALGIALITVSWQSWRAATRNPVEALRYE
jgi:putative ABC transport system permease protein